jgi:hypothetical protein
VAFVFGAVAFDKFDLAILTTKFLHLIDRGVRPELSYSALPQFSVNPLVVGIPVCQ